MRSTHSGYRSLVFVIVTLALASAGAYMLIRSKPTPPAQPSSERIWTVSTLRAHYQPFTPQLQLYGRVEAPRSAQLSAAINADVKARHVDEGQAVQAGQLLLTLDDRDARLILTSRQAQRDEIQARLNAETLRHKANLDALEIERNLLLLAEKAVTRIEQLKGRQVSSETQLDDARRAYQQQALALNNRQRDVADYPARQAQLQAQLHNANALVDSAELELLRTQIIAPFDGLVTTVLTAPGSRVRSGDPLLRLYQNDRLQIRAQLPSQQLGPIRHALTAGEHLSASAELDGATLQLQLQRLAAEVEAGQAGVDALFSISPDTLLPEVGRTLLLQLQLPPLSRAVALPAQSVYGQQRIYRIHDNRLQALQITRLGETTVAGQPLLLVSAPELEEDDLILTTQLPNAIDGLAVRIRE